MNSANIATFSLIAVSMAGAYALSRALTGLSIRLARRWGALSPVTARSSHTAPTPRLGGVGLALGFGLASAFLLAGLRLIPRDLIDMDYDIKLIGWAALGWALMFAVGLLDDLLDLPPLLKLALMVAAALAPAWGGGLVFYAASPVAPAMSAASLLNLALTLLWILFFTNAFNFMDGMDGFAANFARVSSFFMFIVILIPKYTGDVLYSPGQGAEAWLLPILAMACAGFLRWNAPPARVFMGDAGSLSVGYLLALFVIRGQQGPPEMAMAPFSSLTILMPFIFDAALTLVRRARRGENLLRAHREHLYQRLMRSGLSHRETLNINIKRFILCGAAAVAAAVGAEALGHRALWEWAGAGVALLVMLDYWHLTLARERKAAGGGE